MRLRRAFRIVLPLVAAAMVAVPRAAFAELGGDARSVDADRQKMQGALMQIVRRQSHVVHELRAASGTTVREYVTDGGTVFAVAWDGPWLPDLRQLLGSHYGQFQSAVRSRARRARGVVSVNESDLVVQMTGHPRAFTGRAYMPGLLPQGVRPEAIR